MACDNCPTAVDPTLEENDVNDFKRYTKGSCFGIVDIGINIFRALKDIALAIREYAEIAAEKGYASALIHFKVTEIGTISDGVQFTFTASKSPFTYKVTGWGISTSVIGNSTGAYAGDDTITVKLWDFTASHQIGDNLILSKIQLQDAQSDGGNPIGANISPGHSYGIIGVKSSTDAGTLDMSDIDVYIHVEPQELITEI